MGLGLYVARRLMEEQGGELLADDCPTGGARFLVRFPVEERRAVAARTDRTRVERETTPESLRPPHRGAVGARRQAHALATPTGDQRSRVGGER